MSVGRAGDDEDDGEENTAGKPHGPSSLPSSFARTILARRIRECQLSFEQVIALIESSKPVQVLEHPNAEGYPNQLLYEVDLDGYVQVVPAIRRGRILFLKTIYPSRKATRRRSKGERA